MRAIVFVILTAVSVTLTASDAHAEQRVALIIGNSNYEAITPLANPQNDARLMAATLREVGFEVITVTDADRRAMGRAIQEFGRALRAAGPDAVGLFFYAGHGLQSQGQNFLLPLKANILDEADLDLEAISASDILAQMEGAGNALNLVILDACRDNPFGGSRGAGGRGLARVEAASGSLVAFAAAPGESAADGDGANSPYTRALAAAIAVPGLPIEQVFKRARIQVRNETAGRQTPWEESSLLGDFYFVPGTAAASSPSQPAATSGAVERAWAAVEDTQSQAVLEAFLQEYPGGLYAALARARLEQLEDEPEEDRVAVGIYPEQPQPTGQYQPGDEFRDCDVCPQMVVVPAGSFTMGSPESEEGHQSNESPQRRVTIPRPFAVGKFEVTFAEWDACHSEGGCHILPEDEGWGRGDRPVINVTWNRAMRYVAWLSKKTGETYRLLSEAEWEYAARAGTTTPFSTGSLITALQANHNGSARNLRRTASVGTSSIQTINRFGLHDMHGNVAEWVQDCWNGSYEGAPNDGSARMSGDCGQHVQRGGSWVEFMKHLRSARRRKLKSYLSNKFDGFRVARTLVD